MRGNATNGQAPLYLSQAAVTVYMLFASVIAVLSVACCVRVCKQRCKKNTESAESA